MKLASSIRQAQALYREIDNGTTGWATQSFLHAMAWAALLGIAGWQVVMVGALLIESPPAHLLALLVAIHAGVGACALAATAGRVPILLVVVAAYASFFADWSLGASWNGPLLLAACWTANLASATPGTTVAGRKGSLVVIAYAVSFPPLMIWTRPDLGPQLPVAVFVTAIAILVAFWIGLAYPLGFVHQADTQEAVAEEQERLVVAQRAAIQRTAEDARVLHDTVINTLGAIASGGAAVADTEAVRQRCAQDIKTVQALDERSFPQPDRQTLREATQGLGVQTIHTGLSDDQVERYRKAMPPGTLDAAIRAVVELVLNTAKHAGVDTVAIHTSVTDDRLQIVVADEGKGFTGDIRPGGGLARSVVDRDSEAGIDVRIDTAPAHGTRVTLTCWVHDPRGAQPEVDITDGASTVVEALLVRAGFALSIGLATVGFILAFANHPGTFNGEYAMALIVALVTALSWWQHSTGRCSGASQVAVLAAAASAAFACSAAAVGFGRTDAVFWQAIGPTGPLILLTVLHRSTRANLAGVALYVAAMAGIILSLNRSHLDASANVVIAGLAGLGLVLGWDRFQATLRAIGSRAAAAHRRSRQSQRELTAQAAAAAARHRWQSAGLRDSVRLLQRIADGADPSDPELRLACAHEETYLRQVTQLSPQVLQMGRWLARALADARGSGAALTVRSGDTDVSESDASTLGQVTLAAVHAIPSGERITVTLYPSGDQATLTIVAPHPHLVDASSQWDRHVSTRVEVQRFGEQDMLEISVPAWGQIPRPSAETIEGAPQ